MFTPEELAIVDDIRSRYPTSRAALLGVLHLVQERDGHVSDAAAEAVAELLSIPAEDVLGVVTFYEMFRREPEGAHVLHVCTNVSCLLCGSDLVLATLRERLGIGPGETTPDGRFTIHEAECLGSCGTAPMLSAHGVYHERLTPGAVNALIDALEARAPGTRDGGAGA
jgi:NADH-quinone oxidoreductase subunit E